jgi:nucleoside-diphosphate-sugar epimerase
LPKRVTVRDIAGVVAKKLEIPLVSRSPEEAAAHFGPFAPFVSADRPTSSAHTREALGWQPRERGLLEDLEKKTYFDH